MSDRQERTTKIAPYGIRLQIWQEACEATRRHIQLAKAIQGTGGKLLTTLQESQGADPIEQAKLYSQALSNIERGAKIERDAHRELIDLHNTEPRE
jgi:hypothetical protein